MSQTPPPILPYGEPDRAGNGWVARLIAGVAAGALTFTAMAFLRPNGVMLVAGVLGLLVGAVSSAFARRNLVLAGIWGNLIAWISLIVIASAERLWHGAGPRSRIDWSLILVVALLHLGLFVLPGLLGSLWVWEGRKPMPWDGDGPAE